MNLTVYYGPGTVKSNELGVDLSEFACGQLSLPDAERKNIRQVKYWLTTSFSLDPNVCSVSIQAVWTKSAQHIKRELKPIDRTYKWLAWLRCCRERMIQHVAYVMAVPKEDDLVEGGGGV